MRRDHGKVVPLLVASAMLALLAAMATSAWATAWSSAVPSAIALACLALASIVRVQDPSPSGADLLRKVREQTDAGRQLVIYERETGLFAHWYLGLRGAEECDRATRYRHALTLALIECTRDSDAWTVQGQVADRIRRETRSVDVAGYMGNARYVILMPETDGEQAARALERIRQGGMVDTATSTLGVDGTTFAELYAVAARRLADPASQAA